MRIIYLHSTPIPARSANSVQAMRTCHGLADLGHDVTLIAPGDDSDLDAVKATYGVSGFEIERPRASVRQDAFRPYLRTIATVLQAVRYRPDLVYGRDPLTLDPASRLARRPAILEIHADPSDDAFKMAHRWAFKSIQRNRRLVGVATNSELLRWKLEASGFRARIIAAPNAAMRPAPTEPALPVSDRLQAGYTGHLYEGRGIGLIVDLARSCPWADFHIVGGDEDDLARWRHRVGDLANLNFHGFVPPSKVDGYLASFDVLLAPYEAHIAETASPLKLAQYMAHGKAIICSKHPLTADFLDDEETALLPPPGNVKGWISALERLRDSQLRSQLGCRARQQFEQRHTIAARTRAILDEFVPPTWSSW